MVVVSSAVVSDDCRYYAAWVSIIGRVRARRAMVVDFGIAMFGMQNGKW